MDFTHQNFTLTSKIVLIGMMGAGKTSVGRTLAKRLGVPFKDSDRVIEARTGLNTFEYLQSHSEGDFRALEKAVMADLMNGPVGVLSTGGGAIVDHETRRLIKGGSFSIWLKAPAKVLLDRALREGDRPLLRAANPLACMRDLLASREPLYAEADMAIENNGRSIDETATTILQAIHKKKLIIEAQRMAGRAAESCTGKVNWVKL